MSIEQIDKARTEMVKESKTLAREARMKEALARIQWNAEVAQKIFKQQCAIGTPEYFYFNDREAMLMLNALHNNSLQLASRALMTAKQLTESNDAPRAKD